MNVSAASSIKSGTIRISGNSLSVDEAKFADSDLNVFISVKVINQTTAIKNPDFLGHNGKMKTTNETGFQTFGIYPDSLKGGFARDCFNQGPGRNQKGQY
ncbi:hypothetical protein V8C34DRAFT_297756, partial [Trichoderma compactum]